MGGSNPGIVRDGLVVVTGATGHLGGNLVRALLAEGRRVRAAFAPNDSLVTLGGLDVERAPADVRDAESIRSAIRGAEVVYHLAGYVTLMPGRDALLRAVNVDGVRNVVDACLTNGVSRVVHVSSVQALSPFPVEDVVDESRPLCTDLEVPAYDRSKAAGEVEIARGVERGLDAVVVNPTALIGPLDHRPSHPGALFLSLCRGRQPALARLGYNWVDVRDVAAGAMAAERRGRTGRRYLLAGHWRSLREMAAALAKVTGVAAPRLEVPLAVVALIAPLAWRWAALTGAESTVTPHTLHGVRHYRNVSSERAAGELGYRSRPIEETVTAIVDGFRECGMLPRASRVSASCAG